MNARSGITPTQEAPAPAGRSPSGGRVLHVSPAPGGADPGLAALPGMDAIDIYALGEADLAAVSGIFLSAMCDQIYLSRQRDRLEEFVRGGGRIVVNGHVVTAGSFLPGLVAWRRMEYHGPVDLVIERVNDHPVFEGVDLADVLYRTGPPRPRTPEELARIGVAGFYGRGYHLDLPDSATVVNSIGRLRAPIDYAYPIGAGSVLVHGGLDLVVFAKTPGTSLTRLGTNLVTWLGGAA